MISILRDFKNRGGVWFFSSNVFDKFIRVSLTFFLIAFLSKTDFAHWTFALTFVSTFIPIKSLGIEVGILQYGSGLKMDKIDNLFKFMFLRGLLYSSMFTCFCVLITLFVFDSSSNLDILICILSLWLPSFFLFELQLNYYRITKKHKTYAIVQSFNNILFFLCIILGYFIWSINGVALAFVISPIISFLRFSPVFLKAKTIDWSLYSFNLRDIMFYGVKTSFTNYASVLLFYTDIFLIEYLTNNEFYLSEYRTATIIPFNLGFFAVLYLNNDFVYLVENKLNKKELIKYLKNYTKLFIGFVTLCIVVLFPFADFWWSEVLFKGEYVASIGYFKVLLLATVAMILLRIPSGNLLSAIGKVHLNTIIGYITVTLNIILSYTLFQYYGVIGVAYSTVVTLMLSGITMYLFLLRYLNKKT